jgi:hypothetical protein
MYGCLNFIKWIEMLYDRVQKPVIIAVVKLKLNSFAKNVMNFIVKSVHQLLINLHKLTTIVVKVARMQKTNINCKNFNYVLTDFEGSNINLQNFQDDGRTMFLFQAEKNVDSQGFDYFLTAWIPNKQDIEALVLRGTTFVLKVVDKHTRRW